MVDSFVRCYNEFRCLKPEINRYRQCPINPNTGKDYHGASLLLYGFDISLINRMCPKHSERIKPILFNDYRTKLTTQTSNICDKKLCGP
jgi:hypothetical protein